MGLNKDLELAWAAGYFEGEGCFSLQKRKERPSGRPQAGATVRNTDEDTLRRFHAAVGVGSVAAYPPQVKGNKPFWQWCVKGYPTTRSVIILLYPWLGERRRARAEELLLNCARLGHSQAKFSASVEKDKELIRTLRAVRNRLRRGT